MRSTSNHLQQWLLRGEVLSLTQEKRKRQRFSYLFDPPKAVRRSTMDNRARRKQELELWQVVEPSHAKSAQRRARATSARTGQRKSQNRTNVQIVTLAPSPNIPKHRKSRTTAQARRKQRARQRQVRFFRYVTVTSLLALCVVLFFFVKFLYRNLVEGAGTKDLAQDAVQSVFWENLLKGSTVEMPEIQEDFLSISEYNRPGTTLASVNNIFVHYTANPKTSAAQNRSYFEGLAQTHERAASAHFIIGCEGEVIQCIPLNEEAYAVIGRNNDSISIECCYISEDGAFTQATYDSLIHMLAWLIEEYDLEAQDILRHYDCGEKLCPLYYVEHEDAWEQLLDDVAHYASK